MQPMPMPNKNGFNPNEIMQMLTKFTDGSNGLNVFNAEQTGREIIQKANLNQNQLNMIQQSANMVYGMAQRFGILK